MKRILPIVAALTVICSAGMKQAVAKVPGQPISYVRALPLAVRKQMPKNAKSCFFGSFKLASTGPKLWLHLYDGKLAKESDADYQRGKYEYTVDIFQASRTNKGKLRLIRRFFLNYKGWDWVPDKFGVQLLWLDPKQRHSPIFKFDCFTVGGYGPGGDNVLAIFPQGLAGEPVVQSFTFGTWHSSDTLGRDISFNNIDKNGFLEIHSQIYLATNEVPRPSPSILQWNGEKFAPKINATTK